MTGENAWNQVSGQVATLRLIGLGRIEGDAVKLGAVLHHGLGACVVEDAAFRRDPFSDRLCRRSVALSHCRPVEAGPVIVVGVVFDKLCARGHAHQVDQLGSAIQRARELGLIVGGGIVFAVGIWLGRLGTTG